MSKLLIVDHPIQQLTAIKNFLQAKDYVVKTLTNTSGLFTEIFRFRPDLLILPLLAGREGTKELCRQLRNHPDTRYLGILVFSQATESLADYKGLADDAIENPFNLHLLYDKIKSLLTWIPIRKKALDTNTSKI
jgi:DNA-binding response OmpR family regulator